MTARRAVLLLVTVAALVFLAPVLADVYGQLPDVLELSPWWLVAIVLSVSVQLVSSVELHRLLLRTDRWLDVGAPLLAGNAASHVFPGGNAIGAGLQVRMMSTAGFALTRAVTALGAVSVIGLVSGFVVLPLFVLAASAIGTDVDSRLVPPLWIGVGGLTVIFAAVIVAARRDRPWHTAATAIAWVRRTLRRPADAVELEARLLRERDQVFDVIRGRVGRVVVVELGRDLGDFVALYLALRAVGADVNPAAALAAFIVSNLAGMIPITPGGLGFVEAGLTGVLTLTGTTAAEANVAVAAYRVGATWIPCLASIVAFAWFRHRHRGAAGDRAAVMEEESVGGHDS